MERPTGVVLCAVLFLAPAAYLLVVGLVMLGAPGAVSMAVGAPLLSGLEVAGPYMFLLMGAVGALIGWGLWHMNNWARRVATIIAMLGIVMLVPSVSAAAVGIHTAGLIWGGLGIAVRAALVWYLYQTSVAGAFQKK
jgi:hypothetical protein